MIVFPRTAVQLTMHGHESLIASPNVAIFYNHDTYYERQKLSDDGDQCEFFQFSPSLLQEIMAEHGAATKELSPFPFTHAFLNKDNYLLQRRLIEALFNQQYPSALHIDESAVWLLEQLIADSFNQYGTKPKAKPSTQQSHRQLTQDAQALLLTHYDRQLSLQKLADMLFVSPYHLSRVFRQQMGCTLHHFLEQIRLRTAYERLGDYRKNLSQLALEVGYSSHSHFSEAFHRNFGFPPSVHADRKSVHNYNYPRTKKPGQTAELFK